MCLLRSRRGSCLRAGEISPSLEFKKTWLVPSKLPASPVVEKYISNNNVNVTVLVLQELVLFFVYISITHQLFQAPRKQASKTESRVESHAALNPGKSPKGSPKPISKESLKASPKAIPKESHTEASPKSKASPRLSAHAHTMQSQVHISTEAGTSS